MPNLPPKKIAVILFNLGGPLTSQDVKPFLYRLFSDPLIIRLPSLLRHSLAYFISRLRAPLARKNYQFLGGGSPLLKHTKAQAKALKAKLKDELSNIKDIHVFIAMRYWHPLTEEVVKQVQQSNPDEIILLPLYPHYSTTTTQSSLSEWQRQSLKHHLNGKPHIVCCFYDDDLFIQAHLALLKEEMKKFPPNDATYFLFSAHGVPQKIIDEGDPYQTHIEKSVQKIAHQLGLHHQQWGLSYQSRVGPLKWLEPETGSEIRRLAREEKIENLFLIPISFVSEHIETLVELDIEFGAIAREEKIKHYIRVPTLSCHPIFISCLARLVKKSLSQDEILCPDEKTCVSDLYL